ncbi:MAG: SLBB domain-containing protein, partial [Deltaproteobacteria bacterium]|nr:SLBB domain-containing protein [Deltaproteobacteria bacterium]
EGDPSVYIARTLFECDPHSILEGMLISAYASGASHGLIFINNQYKKAIEVINTALQKMRELGLLGENIMGTKFKFDLEIRTSAGAHIEGEETALLNSIEGKRATTSIRPPYPTQSGLFGKPTVISNIETLSHVSAILQKGADWYAGIGTDRSKGTKIFVLGGSVAKPGLVEAPMGTTVRQLVYDLGGGVSNGKALKAVQVGGPLGGLVNEEDLDLSLDFETLKGAGHIMGSGGIFVLDGSVCAVDFAKNCLQYLEKESCGKCVFCREGTLQFALILKDISEGRGKKDDIEILLEFGEGMKEGAFCAFGRNAANPVLSAIKYFREEYVEHIADHKCPAGVCKIG